MSENEKQVSKFAPSNWKDKLGGSAHVLKITTGSAWKYISTLVGVFLLGIIVNIIFFVFLQSKIDYQFNKGGEGYLLAILACLFLFLIFPTAYFFVGHKQALQSVIYYIGNHFKKGIFEYFIDRLFDFANKKPAIKAQLENDKTDDFFNTTIPEYLGRLDNMNGTLKRVFKKFTGNIDLLGLFTAAQNELGGNLSLDNLKNYVSEKAAEKIPIPMLSKPSWAWAITVMFMNILFFATFLILLG